MSSYVRLAASSICLALASTPLPGAPTDTFLPSRSSTVSIPSTATICIISGYSLAMPRTFSIFPSANASAPL